jgi:RecA-family ATPase
VGVGAGEIGVSLAAVSPPARVAPHSLDAEKSVLGAVFIKPAVFDELATNLAVDDFFLPAHREVFEAMAAIDKRREPIDVLAVGDELKTAGKLARLDGGSAYLNDLANAVPTAEHALNYARLVREKATLRRLIAACADIQSSAYGDFGEFDAFMNDAVARLATVVTVPAKLAARLATIGDDWIAEALPPREHLLIDARTGTGAVDKTGAWLLAGAGGGSKSFASLDLSLAIVTGEMWLGTFGVARPGRVLLVLAEDGVEDVRRRIHTIAATKGYRPRDVAGRIKVLGLKGTLTSMIRLDRERGTYVEGDGLGELRALIASERKQDGIYDLTVIDPIARVAGVSLDKDSEAATKLMDALEALSEATGGLVLGVCHTNKISREKHAEGKVANAADVRGSTALTDGARGVMSLRPDVGPDGKPTVVLSIVKANHVRPWNDVVLQRDDRGVLVPLNAVDRALYDASRRKQSPEERAATKEAKREAAAHARVAADALVVRQVMADGSVGKLRDRVKSRLACGSGRADRAIARVQDEDSGAGCPVPTPPPDPPSARGTEAPGVPSGASHGASEAPRHHGAPRGTIAGAHPDSVGSGGEL